MSELTDTLASLLGNRVRLSTPVSAVTSRQGRYTAHLAEGADEEFENVVMAAPAWAQSTMLKELAPEISEQLDAIEYPALAVVCMGFDRTAIGPGMDGFGFLVPSREKRGILGTVADSNVFGGRAPQGKILLRTMVGGARSPHLARLEDAELLDLVCSDLKDIMGVGAEPEFAQIYRHERAIPQYLRGHAKRLEKIGEELKKHAGLLLTGNAYRGVSLNDCVLNAEHTAGKLFPAVD